MDLLPPDDADTLLLELKADVICLLDDDDDDI
jgi:hypothetical protein